MALVIKKITCTSLPVGVDNTGLTMTTGGNANWECDTAISHDGIDPAISGSISNNQNTWVKATVTLAAQNTLIFWWKVSSEANWDYLRFYMDGVDQAGSISGEINW